MTLGSTKHSNTSCDCSTPKGWCPEFRYDFDECENYLRIFMLAPVNKIGLPSDSEVSPVDDEEGNWIELISKDSISCYKAVPDVDVEVLTGDGYSIGEIVAVDCNFYISQQDGNKQYPEADGGGTASQWEKGSIIQAMKFINGL